MLGLGFDRRHLTSGQEGPHSCLTYLMLGDCFSMGSGVSTSFLVSLGV